MYNLINMYFTYLGTALLHHLIVQLLLHTVQALHNTQRLRLHIPQVLHRVSATTSIRLHPLLLLSALHTHLPVLCIHHQMLHILPLPCKIHQMLEVLNIINRIVQVLLFTHLQTSHCQVQGKLKLYSN